MPACLFKHVEQIAQFTQKTVFKYARSGGMIQGEISEKRDEFEKLKKRIGKRVGYVSLKSRE